MKVCYNYYKIYYNTLKTKKRFCGAIKIALFI